jgi:mono/diheme cytochrome c family protein
VHVALHWRWLLTGVSKRFGVAAWAERSPRLAGSVLLAAAAVPLTALAIGAHLSVRAMDQPLHPLDESRQGAAPGATPTAGAVSSTTAPLASRAPGADARDTIAARAAAVLADRCASCHGAREPAAGVRADTLDALLREAQGPVRWVVPGRPDESRLLEVVATPRHRLSPSDADALRAWIASLRD